MQRTMACGLTYDTKIQLGENKEEFCYVRKNSSNQIQFQIQITHKI